MKIAIIGSGRMAQALGALFVEAGHEVMLTNSRGPESLGDLIATIGPNCHAGEVTESVAWGDVVVLATPWGKTAEAVSVVDDWTDVVVVDTTNNRSKPGPDGLIDIGDNVSSVLVAGYVPGARVVKAFNATPIPFLVPALGANAGANNAVYVAGDDPAAKSLVASIIASIGGEAVDTGDLATGGWMQGMSGPLAGTLEMLTPADARSRVEAARAAGDSHPSGDVPNSVSPHSNETRSKNMAIVALSKTVEVPATTEEVWAFVSDFAGYASWQPHIESVEMQSNGDRKVTFTRGDSVLDRVSERDEAGMRLAYELVPGQATPLASLLAAFTVRSADAGSEVEYAITVEVPDAMEDMAKFGIGADIDGALAGLQERFSG
jgi:predicted dinucleotide-binding enzyme/carbon monoxide dehydrogenase subunit G